MKIEEFEKFTDEFLRDMRRRVEYEHDDILREDLMEEYRTMVKEFESIHPVLERYSENFEFNYLYSQREMSTQYVTERIMDNIMGIKRMIEKDEDINKIRQIQEQQNVESNYGRMTQIDDILSETFNEIYHVARRNENINLDALRQECRRIQERRVEAIEENVFEKNEKQAIERETNRFIDELEEEMIRSRRQEKNEGVTFVEGPVCPVVSDINAFAEKSKNIADEFMSRKTDEREKDDMMQSLPGDVLE